MDAAKQITGVLLCAGRGSRFDPLGRQNKLLQPLDSGLLVAQQSARKLRAALPRVVAVLRPGQDRLRDLLDDEACETVICQDADEGMAASLRCALHHARDADGWLVALADMPFVAPATLVLLLHALQDGQQVVVPVRQGRRGNPVGFAQSCLPVLLTLQGDAGARSLLGGGNVTAIEVDDDGIHRDIDTPDDLRKQAVRS